MAKNKSPEKLTRAEKLLAETIITMRALFDEDPYVLAALVDWIRNAWKGEPHVLKRCKPAGVAVVYARPIVEKLKAATLNRSAVNELRAAVTA